MLLIQMTGLSGAGKSTLAQEAKRQLHTLGYKVEILDGDEYRRHLCADLGFSKADRLENIRRLSFVADRLVKHGIIAIIAAINPYDEGRQAVKRQYSSACTVFVDCPIDVVAERDVKGLYRRARLKEDHPEYLDHFTGVSDPYSPPTDADFIIRTDLESPAESGDKLVAFILQQLQKIRKECLNNSVLKFT